MFDINSFLAEKLGHLRGSFEIPPPIRLPDDNQTVQDVPGKSTLLKFTVWGNWNHFELFGSKTWNFRQLLFFWDTLYIKIYTITPDFKAWHYWIWPLHCFITPCVTALMCFAIVILQLPSQFPTVQLFLLSLNCIHSFCQRSRCQPPARSKCDVTTKKLREYFVCDAARTCNGYICSLSATSPSHLSGIGSQCAAPTGCFCNCFPQKMI